MARGSSPGERRGGRKAGVPNKLTIVAKDAIALAAEKLGGPMRLVSWAKEDPANERVFWSSIYPRLIPVQLAGDRDNPLVHEIIERVVDPKV